MKEEEEYEERMRTRRTKERDRAYKQVSTAWDAPPPPMISNLTLHSHDQSDRYH